ncbi:GTP-binding protein [Paenibacillus lycopersici]|uniref:GTP-binding protein n=1 Tax=Paenibacillus lycopersici TaxID=2704462 RepID=A0A6C0G6E7_9BACL|nr:GTP-binding protein [Paenibacillus lycopersici]QHT61085.1 GTP-binding protein [Paenibacillus lycopersici]
MRIPVLILSGFLGSGKTTLLLRLLAAAGKRGLKPGILMNELGRKDVDGLILQESLDLSISRLLDGCVCCSKKEEMTGKLLELIDDRPDLIVIELTGVANPEEVALALSDPQLLRQVKLQRIVTVLDAEHVLAYNSWFQSDQALVRTLRRQIETADVLVLNKLDLVSASVRFKVEKALRKQNATSPIWPAIQSNIDTDLLLEGIEKTMKASDARLTPLPGRGVGVSGKRRILDAVSNRSHENPSFTRVATLSFELPSLGQLTSRQIEQFLALHKEVLLRAKGYFKFSHQTEPFLLQYSGKRVTWEAAPQYEGVSYLVLIGLDWDEADVIRELEMTLERNGIRNA